MDQEKEELIKKLTLEGKDKADVRRALISHGFSTEGFDVVYDSLVKDVPKPATVPKKTVHEIAKGAIIGDYQSFQENINRKKAIRQKRGPSLFNILVLFVCCGVLYVLWTEYLEVPKVDELLENFSDSSQVDKSFDPADTLIIAKVDSTVSSAEYFETRIGAFSEVCKEIVVIAPVMCLETEEDYVIYAPISEGDYYCADSSRFKGALSKEPTSGESCI